MPRSIGLLCRLPSHWSPLTGVPAGEAAPDGTYPEGKVDFLVHRRLKELADRAPTFRGNGEPASTRRDDSTPAHD